MVGIPRVVYRAIYPGWCTGLYTQGVVGVPGIYPGCGRCTRLPASWVVQAPCIMGGTGSLHPGLEEAPCIRS